MITPSERSSISVFVIPVFIFDVRVVIGFDEELGCSKIQFVAFIVQRIFGGVEGGEHWGSSRKHYSIAS